jgi:hypothetical protein
MKTNSGQTIAVDLGNVSGQPVLLLNNQTFPISKINGTDTAIINGQSVSILVAQHLGTQPVGNNSDSDIEALSNLKAGSGTVVYRSSLLTVAGSIVAE